MNARPTSIINVRNPKYDNSLQTVQVVTATHTRTRGYITAGSNRPRTFHDFHEVAIYLRRDYSRHREIQREELGGDVITPGG